MRAGGNSLPVPPELEEAPALAFGIESVFEGECSECQDIGYVRDNLPTSHPEFGKLLPCPSCKGGARMENLRAVSRLTPEMMGHDLKDFLPRNHLHDVRHQVTTWLRVGYGWLTLTGPPGTGKTFLLSAIANLVIAEGKPALYTTVADLLDDLKATFNPKSDQIYSTLFASVMGVEYLLLDEIEKFYGTAWAMEAVFRLMEHRSRHTNLKTVLATNVDLRPLQMGKVVSLHPESLHVGYLESRIMGGTLVADFWRESDFRPELARLRAQSAEVLDDEWEQGELV